MNIKIDHINLTVRNLEESRTWYAKLFGFKTVERGLTSQLRNFEILAFHDFMICMSEFVDQFNDDGLMKQNQQRIYHFGIRVDDEVEWKRRVEAQKVDIRYGGPVEYPRSRSWYIKDPNGHEIEVSYTLESETMFPETL